MDIGYFSNIMPLRMIWMSGLFRIIGGGDQVLVSSALVMVADMSSEEQRYRNCPIYTVQSNCSAEPQPSSVSNPAWSSQRFWPLQSARIL